MKYMKPKLNIVLILAITSIAANQISAHAESGGRDGHGGGVNVCGQTAELYDFFEGQKTVICRQRTGRRQFNGNIPGVDLHIVFQLILEG